MLLLLLTMMVMMTRMMIKNNLFCSDYFAMKSCPYIEIGTLQNSQAVVWRRSQIAGYYFSV
jgi:hypothetical protein